MLILEDSRLPMTLRAAYEKFARTNNESSLVPGPTETALGAPRPDLKSYIEFDGKTAPQIPKELEGLRSLLIAVVEDHSDRIEKEWGPFTKGLRHLTDRISGALLRMSSYPARVHDFVNHPHTDIDLFTVLPAPTQPGLEIEISGRWKAIETKEDQLLLLPGDLIQHFGGPSPARHRVVSNGLSRISASLFINANPLLKIGETSIAALVAQRLALVRGAS